MTANTFTSVKNIFLTTKTNFSRNLHVQIRSKIIKIADPVCSLVLAAMERRESRLRLVASAPLHNLGPGLSMLV